MHSNEDKPTTSKAAKDETFAKKQTNNTSTLTTSTPLRTKFSKTVSSPTSLSLVGSSMPTTPTLGQVGKQSSINQRNSFLSDSDTDDQALLLRQPSVRSHKFIIIPASSPLGQQQQQQLAAGGKIPLTTSTASLTALQKLPLTRPQSVEPTGSGSVTPNELKFAMPRTPILNIALQQYNEQKAATSTLPCTPTAKPKTATDVIHQSETFKSRNDNNTTAIATTTPSGVKFTIEDYESDNATDATTNTKPGHSSPTAAAQRISSPLDALYSQKILENIYSTTDSSNLTLPQQQQQKSSSQTPLLTVDVAQPASSPFGALSSGVRRPVSALIASNQQQFNTTSSASGTPSLGIGLRPRYDRNSSMRSIVSGEFFFLVARFVPW